MGEQLEARDKVAKIFCNHIVAMLKRMGVKPDYPVIGDTVADILGDPELKTVSKIQGENNEDNK